jgi:DNA invertase Pin-like site-specific DNA recombinase
MADRGFGKVGIHSRKVMPVSWRDPPKPDHAKTSAVIPTLRIAIYARVSTQDQHCELQLSELRAYCQRWGWTDIAEYVEKASGKAGQKRPALEQLLADARLKKVDVVLVWKIDRFGRSVQEFVERVRALADVGVRFIAPNQGIDTDQHSPAGRLLMHVLAAIAEFERDLIQERVRAGVAEAKRQGKHCGRPKKVFRRDEAQKLRAEGLSWRAIARRLGVPQATIRLALSGVQKA